MTLFSGDPKVGLVMTLVQLCWNIRVEKEEIQVPFSPNVSKVIQSAK